MKRQLFFRLIPLIPLLFLVLFPGCCLMIDLMILDAHREIAAEQAAAACRREVQLALAGAEASFALEWIAETDEERYEFVPGLAGIRAVKCEKYFHGTFTGESSTGTSREYIGIPFKDVRRLSADYPLSVRLADESVIGAEGGDWYATFSNGTLTGFQFVEEESRVRTIELNNISEILIGEYPSEQVK